MIPNMSAETSICLLYKSPKVEQYNLQNRWAWMGDQYVFQASVKAMKEDRTSGQADVYKRQV